MTIQCSRPFKIGFLSSFHRHQLSPTTQYIVNLKDTSEIRDPSFAFGCRWSRGLAMSSFARRMIGFEGMPRRDERSVDWEWIQRHGCLLARVHSVYVCVCVRWGGGSSHLVPTKKKEQGRHRHRHAWPCFRPMLEIVVWIVVYHYQCTTHM